MKRLLRVDGRGNASVLGPLETRVMEEVWRHGDWISVSDLMPVFRSKLAYSTIKTILSNLAEKGHLRKRTAGRAGEFMAASTREAFDEKVVADLMKPLIAHYRNPLLAHIVDQLDDLDDNEGLAELARLLREKRRRRDG
jgi:predicted transcriptional regulator